MQHSTQTRRTRKWSLTQGLNELDDQRIREIKPLIPPQILIEDLPVSDAAANTIKYGRASAERIVRREDDRLMVVVGPCSIHDPKAAIEYAHKLKAYADTCQDDLLIIMRCLINDPFLNGSFEINKGLRTARQLLLEVNEIGLPAGCEFLDTISPQYTADLVAWGAIGARTTESQIHRELASGLSVPVGFKNASHGHYFLSVTKQGLSAIVSTEGNESCHVILRGGAQGPNYAEEHVSDACCKLKKVGLKGAIMVDCSHGNSSKVFSRQSIVADDVAQQLSSGSTADCIFGVMIESNLVEGRQDLKDNVEELTYGQSITDACLGWDATVAALERLREGVRARRQNKQ
ncbi:3-deoxy-7-phosphoheptulonate synthase [Syncephalis fuscata]|nr:3-deoxy-7-phosphoheptulonate synthase [Syncephalis fuscata]